MSPFAKLLWPLLVQLHFVFFCVSLLLWVVDLDMTLMSSDVSVLLLVLNAAVDSPTMLPLFPHHLSSHYTCLRNTLPHMVPSLPVSNCCLVSNDHTVCNILSIVRLFGVHLCTGRVLSPVCAGEHCRISPPRLLAKCRNRRLNKGSFVLLCFVCLLFMGCV